MTTKNGKLGGVLGITLLTIAALSTTSCDEDGDGIADGPLGDLQRQCGLSCPAAGKGVAFGNASITGYGPIDGFFRSVVNFSTVSAGVSAEIDAELNGIQSLFGVTDAELAAAGNLGAAVTAKLNTTYKASVVVNAQPARCSVDARVAAQVTAECQAAANCDVNTGEASFQCMGTCTVEADVMGNCSADAQARCTVSGPSVTCMGECSGSCSVQTPVVNCEGTCNGTCMGTCSAMGANGQCAGTCTGTCMAGCEVSGMAAVNCMGTCNGSCEYNKPAAGCEAGAQVNCDLNAQASATCKGSCSGDFKPPHVECDASASCEASAKAEAKFQVQCTPPSLEVKVVAQAGGAAQAQVDFLIAQLRLRLPRLSAATARAKIASEAGAELIATGQAAVQATASALAEGEVDFIVGAKISACMPPQLTESQTVVAGASAELKKRTDNAATVANAFGMVM